MISSWLFRADLREAILLRADLKGANLQEADLRGAFLVSADLSHTNLLRASVGKGSLSPTTLFDAIMPDGRKYEDWIQDKEGKTLSQHIKSCQQNGCSPQQDLCNAAKRV